MLAEYSNPAGRLHSVLSDAFKRSPKTVVRAVWADVLDVAPDDTGQILFRLAELIQQIAAGRDAVARVEDVDTDLFLRPFGVLEKAFVTVNLEAPWEQFRNRIDPATMVALEYSAEMLSHHMPEDEIPVEKLDDLRAEVEKLLETVLKSDIDEELRTTLVEYLERIRLAILAYRLRGADGLQEALDQTLGLIARRAREARSSSERTLFKRVWELLRNLNTAVSLAKRIKELAPPELETLLQLPPGG